MVIQLGAVVIQPRCCGYTAKVLWLHCQGAVVIQLGAVVIQLGAVVIQLGAVVIQL